jgi:acylphosphatase
VEAIIEGEAAAVDRMIDWLHDGSPMANVVRVQVAEEEATGEHRGFSINY